MDARWPDWVNTVQPLGPPARSGRPSRRSCGQRCWRKVEGGSSGLRSGTSQQPGGTRPPSSPRTWEGWSRLRKAQGARCPVRSAGSAGSEKRREGRRRRSWVPGRSHHCFSPHRHSWHPRASGTGELFFCSFFSGLGFLCSFLCDFLGAHLLFLGTGLGGGQRGACNVPPSRGKRMGKTDIKCATAD